MQRQIELKVKNKKNSIDRDRPKPVCKQPKRNPPVLGLRASSLFKKTVFKTGTGLKKMRRKEKEIMGKKKRKKGNSGLTMYSHPVVRLKFEGGALAV